MPNRRSRCILPPLVALQQFAEQVLVPLQLLLAMLGMGATLRPQDFGVILEDPRGLALGLALQWLFVPAVAVGVITVFGLSPGWALGLLLVAAVPGGATSNLLTFLGRGSVALSIAVTTVTTLACMVTVPALLGLLAADYLPAEFAFPYGRIVRDILLYLLAPLAVGMVIKRLAPGTSGAISKWAIRGSLALIVLITISALGSGRIDVVAYGWRPPLVIVFFATVVALASPQLCRLLGRFDDDTVALHIEVVVRNIGIGLLLVSVFFPGEDRQGHVLYTCLFYAGLSTPFALPTLLRHRLGRSAVPLREPHARPGGRRHRSRA